MARKKEVVSVIRTVEIYYDKESGREYLLDKLMRGEVTNIHGYGTDVGGYEIKVLDVESVSPFGKTRLVID